MRKVLRGEWADWAAGGRRTSQAGRRRCWRARRAHRAGGWG